MPEHGIGNMPIIDDSPDLTEFSESLRMYEQQVQDDLRRQEAAQAAQIETASIFAQLNKRLDQEREERMAFQKSSTRESRIWQTAAITIGLLTLAATVIFGILTLLH